jgi:predicted dehydrogenase
MSKPPAGAAAGEPLSDSVSVTGSGILHPVTGVDEYAIGQLEFPDGIVAAVGTGIGVTIENVVRVSGTDGSILVPSPWIHGREGGTHAKILVSRPGSEAPARSSFGQNEIA